MAGRGVRKNGYFTTWEEDERNRPNQAENGCLLRQKLDDMARADIWQDGINTRFSRDNQPANRGRKKGRPNRATVYRKVFHLLSEILPAIEQQRRDRRNARRRERYRNGGPTAKKRAGGTTHPTQ